MKQPATIPEYKQFCKALKMKILKQKDQIDRQAKQIQRLNAQNANLRKVSQKRQNDLNPPLNSGTINKTAQPEIQNLQTMKGKQQIMKKFKNAVCQFGISPQSIFRIVDLGYRNQVEADYFRKVLGKIDLGLTQMQTSHLIYLFDENYTGYITKDDYNDSLSAFQISTEEPYLPYTSSCLQKLARILQENKIDIPKLYEEMQGKSSYGIDIDIFYNKIRSKFGKLMQLKEIMGAFGSIDLETDGIACKPNFIYSVTAAVNKLQSSVRKQYDSPSVGNKSRISLKKPNSNSLFPNNSQPVPDNTQQSNFYPIKRNQTTSHLIESHPEEKGGFVDQSQQQLIAEIEKQSKITLHQIYEQICRHKLDKRLTLFDFKKIISSIQYGTNKLDSKLGNMLFKAIDYNKGGTIYFKQLIYFYLRHENDMSIIFHLFGIYFSNSDLNSQKFWFLHGVNPQAEVSKTKFLQIMVKTFGSNDLLNDVWGKLWSYFDKGRGVVSVATINKQLSKYQIQS